MIHATTDLRTGERVTFTLKREMRDARGRILGYAPITSALPIIAWYEWLKRRNER
jgi:hypothetical protein